MTSVRNPTKPGMVSVIIRVYNRQQYIAEAIDSVLSQSYTDHEILVVDNGSTMDMASVLRPYENKIRYIYKKRGTVGSAANVGLSETGGEFVSFLDDDDRWHPDMLASVVGILMTSPNVDAVFTRWMSFQGDEHTLQHSYAEPYFTAIEQGEELLSLLCRGNFIPLCATALRRSSVTRIGEFDPDFEIGEDWDLWLRMLTAGCRFEFLKDQSYFHRRHDQNITTQPILLCRQDIAVLEKLLGYVPSPYRQSVKESLADRHRRLGEAFMAAGKTGSAVFMFWRSLMCDPFSYKNLQETGGRFLQIIFGKRSQSGSI